MTSPFPFPTDGAQVYGDSAEADVDQTIVNWIVAAAGAVFGFLLKSVWEAVKDLQAADKALADKVSAIEVLVAGKYVTREELSAAVDRVVAQLDRIEHKLQGKADR